MSGGSSPATREGDLIAERYRSFSRQLGQAVSVRRNTTVAELARTIESGADVLHFVGHHDENGLACVDGAFDATTLSVSNARTFLLNACGSYPQGRTLIEKGSVVGGVTFNPVIDETALRVGTTFARLVESGFSVGVAVDLARRRSLAPADYAVVGDATHVLTDRDDVPPRVRVRPPTDGVFQVELVATPIGALGRTTTTAIHDRPHLGGRLPPAQLSRETLDDWLADLTVPVVYRDELFSPDALRDEL